MPEPGPILKKKNGVRFRCLIYFFHLVQRRFGHLLLYTYFTYHPPSSKYIYPRYQHPFFVSHRSTTAPADVDTDACCAMYILISPYSFKNPPLYHPSRYGLPNLHLADFLWRLVILSLGPRFDLLMLGGVLFPPHSTGVILEFLGLLALFICFYSSRSPP